MRYKNGAMMPVQSFKHPLFFFFCFDKYSFKLLIPEGPEILCSITSYDLKNLFRCWIPPHMIKDNWLHVSDKCDMNKVDDS